jgi:hypothetical protein
MINTSITTDGYQYTIDEQTNEYRIKKCKNGDFVLQRMWLVKAYRYNCLFDTTKRWRDIKTLEEE